MSETNEDRSPGLKRSMTWKLIAALVFVIAGTAVVAYSMNYCRDCNSPDHLAQSDAKNDQTDQALVEQNGDAALNLKPVATDSKTVPPKLPATSINSNFAKTNKSTNPSSENNSNSLTGSFQPGRINRITTQRPASDPPPSKSFSMPKMAKPKSQFGNSSQNGFGAKQANTGTNDFGAKQGLVVNPAQVSGAIKDRFQKFKDGTTQFANNTSQKLKQATDDVVNSTGNALRNFGDRAAQATNSLTAPADTGKSTFAPPKNSSNLNSFSQSNTFPSSVGGNSNSNNGLSGSQSRSNSGSSAPAMSRPQPPVVSNNAKQIQPPVSSALPPTSPVSTNRNINSGVPFSKAARDSTLATPGDRKLEGPQSPSVTIEKIAPREVQVNQPADFQLVVKNVGRIAARNVQVFDQIPAGTEFIQSTPQPSRGSNGQINWQLDTLAPGQEKRIRIQLRPTRRGEIGSVAQVTFSAQASMRTKVTKPVLSISHSTQPRVLIGDPVVLEINVKNEGDGPAADVIVQEDLPPQLEFSEGFRELEYAIGTLGPGQSRKVQLELRAAKIGKFKNILVAHAGGGLQTQHAVDIEVVAPQLVAQGDGPTRRFLRREATHRFSVRNAGTAAATNVELVCRLPSGLRFVSTNNRGKYDENTHSVYWSLAELSSGLVANVELTTIPTEPGNQDLKFEVVSDLDQQASAVCKLNVEHLIDVFFDIDDLVDPIEIGSSTAYQLRVVNQGTKTATNVQLQVEFPAGIQPTAVEGNVSNEIRGQQIAFSPITSMNPGDEIEITIRGKGITAGDHRVAVNLIADGREVNVSKQESTRVYSDR